MSRLAALDPAPYVLADDVLDATLSPALVVHLDRVRENLRRVIAAAGGADRWRPHVKTSKIPAVFAEVARAGVRRFKCATLREAEVLLATLRDEGIEAPDVCLAYPLVGPALRALGAVADAFPAARVSVLCEDASRIAEVPERVSVFVDVNPGMHRTGVPLEDRAAILGVARAAGERFRGVHYYDGHLHEGGTEERRRAVFACYDRLLKLLDFLRAGGVAVEEVVTSGTPTFQHALAYPPFAELDAAHRISPGTVVYHDQRSEEENPELDLLPAAVVLSRVVSHPAPDLATCDAGSKSIAAEAGDPCAFVLGRPDLVALTPSEEHLPLRVTGGARPERGDALYLVPRHVCPTTNLAEEALLVDAGEVVDVVRVSARAHPLRVSDVGG